MRWESKHGLVERLKCPKNFQDRLTKVGGKNRYGQPNFKLAWAQTETTRQGGHWPAEGEEFVGYRDCYLGDGLPHWMLLQWIDAGKSLQMPYLRAQSDVAFYFENKDSETGLQILGEYPYHGSYQIALPLVSKQFIAGQLFIHAFPLSTEIVEMMVPVIKASMEVTIQAKLQYLKDQEEKEEKDRSQAFEDAYRSVRRNPNLASTSWLEDKQRSIEKAFNASLIMMMHRNKRFQNEGRL